MRSTALGQYVFLSGHGAFPSISLQLPGLVVDPAAASCAVGVSVLCVWMEGFWELVSVCNPVVQLPAIAAISFFLSLL